MIEDADDWAVFTDPDVFGETVSYVHDGQPAVSVTAVFTAAYAVVDGRIGPGVATTEPVLTLGAAQLTFTPGQGDLVTLTQPHPGFPAGTTLRVADHQPDGSGLIRLRLERT